MTYCFTDRFAGGRLGLLRKGYRRQERKDYDWERNQSHWMLHSKKKEILRPLHRRANGKDRSWRSAFAGAALCRPEQADPAATLRNPSMQVPICDYPSHSDFR
jgi:hypothetical protein